MPGLVNTLFAAYRLKLPELITHILGHADWNHLVGNFTLILIIGPILEEKYGSNRLLVMILLTALVTGLINGIFFNTGLVGASGIAFMVILLSSVDNQNKGIPLTFIIVAMLFIGKEMFNALSPDNVSQFSHIMGGFCGAGFGFIMRKI